MRRWNSQNNGGIHRWSAGAGDHRRTDRAPARQPTVPGRFRAFRSNPCQRPPCCHAPSSPVSFACASCWLKLSPPRLQLKRRLSAGGPSRPCSSPWPTARTPTPPWNESARPRPTFAPPGPPSCRSSGSAASTAAPTTPCIRSATSSTRGCSPATSTSTIPAPPTPCRPGPRSSIVFTTAARTGQRSPRPTSRPGRPGMSRRRCPPASRGRWCAPSTASARPRTRSRRGRAQ